MKLALVTTPPSIPSVVGEHTRRLALHLRHKVELEIYVEPGSEGDWWDGLLARSALALNPRHCDQILYSIGNEPAHAFMTRMLRVVGGTVDLHAWGLGELARARWPALAHGAWRGELAALREGGLAQWLDYRRNPEARSRLPLNRSVVRFADAFIVPSDELKLQILRERNQATPVGVLPRGAASDPLPAGGSEAAAWTERGLREPIERTDHWERVAESYFELLHAFPAPRAARRGPLALRLAFGRKPGAH